MALAVALGSVAVLAAPQDGLPTPPIIMFGGFRPITNGGQSQGGVNRHLQVSGRMERT